MFEKFEVPAMYVANQAVLSLYSTGPITGVVVESGAGVTYVVPIVDGHAITHAVMRLDIGGADLTEYLTRLLSERGHTLDTAPTARTVVNDIKEKCCSVADDFEARLQSIAATPHFENAYEMPDGNRINIGDAGIRCPEAMFQPSLLGLESAGIHELVHSAVMKCDKDLQQYLYRNVILSGGNAFFPGMKERLQKELRALVTDNNNMIPYVRATPDRNLNAWVGGSILASLSTMERMWITKAEFDECGPTIVNRKCI